MKSAVVLTPSVGSPHLNQCIESLQQQTYASLEHVVVADGPEAAVLVREVEVNWSARKLRHPLRFVYLPYNTGGTGYNGYKILAGFSRLISSDVVLFLDDDNWFEPEHVAESVAAMDDCRATWAFSLRQIRQPDGSVLVSDDCDSLGWWRRAAAYQGPLHHLEDFFVRFYSDYPYLIDTNCFCLKTDLFVELAGQMVNRYWGDALLASALIRTRRGVCVGKRTVNYRVRAGILTSVKEYFEQGNRQMLELYKGEFPWRTRQAREPLRVDDLPT